MGECIFLSAAVIGIIIITAYISHPQEGVVCFKGISNHNRYFGLKFTRPDSIVTLLREQHVAIKLDS